MPSQPVWLLSTVCVGVHACVCWGVGAVWCMWTVYGGGWGVYMHACYIVCVCVCVCFGGGGGRWWVWTVGGCGWTCMHVHVCTCVCVCVSACMLHEQLHLFFSCPNWTLQKAAILNTWPTLTKGKQGCREDEQLAVSCYEISIFSILTLTCKWF